VAAQLRELLMNGVLKPGDRLPAERDLSLRLGVSRSALREALRTLENNGMLELRKGKTGGAFVTSGGTTAVSNNMRDLLHLGNISLSDLTEARVWIEEIVVRVACERATEEDFKALEFNLKQAEELYAEGRFFEKSDVNIEFHNILARATRNPLLVMNVQTITDMVKYFAHRVGTERISMGFEERHRFIKALRSRNVGRAAHEMVELMKRWERLNIRVVESSILVRTPVPSQENSQNDI
jgi:DNA-binding FadR family transcriptional regulator